MKMREAYRDAGYEWLERVSRLSRAQAREEVLKRGLDPFLMDVHVEPAHDPVAQAVRRRIKRHLDRRLPL